MKFLFLKFQLLWVKSASRPTVWVSSLKYIYIYLAFWCSWGIFCGHFDYLHSMSMEKFLINYHSENICLHCLIKQYMRTALPYYIDADVLDAKSQFTMNYRSQDECFINQICFCCWYLCRARHWMSFGVCFFDGVNFSYSAICLAEISA